MTRTKTKSTTTEEDSLCLYTPKTKGGKPQIVLRTAGDRGRMIAHKAAKKPKRHHPQTHKDNDNDDDEDELALPKPAFARVVRQVVDEQRPGLRIQKKAIRGLQVMGERVILKYLRASRLIAKKQGRPTTLLRDFLAVKRLFAICLADHIDGV